MKESRRAHTAIYNAYNGLVYVFGGVSNKGFLDSCERYSIKENHWTPIARMSKKRSLISCCNINRDSIFVFGGYSPDENKELDLIERYDLITDRFYTISYRMPYFLQNPFVIQINQNHILLLGGYNDEKGDCNNVGLLDIFKGEYIAIRPLNEGGWSVYPPILSGDSICLFMDGEEIEQGNFPTFIEYKI
jgi:N-acetylneuraminic acid mutarotase